MKLDNLSKEENTEQASEEDSIKRIRDLLCTKEDTYRIVGYLEKHIPVLVTALPLIAAFFVFFYSVISYIAVGVRYSYWNLEGLHTLVPENSRIVVGFALFAIVAVLGMQTIARKGIEIWRIYNSEINIFEMVQK